MARCISSVSLRPQGWAFVAYHNDLIGAIAVNCYSNKTVATYWCIYMASQSMIYHFKKNYCDVCLEMYLAGFG